MSLWLMVLHLFNFLAPAIGFSLLMGTAEVLTVKRKSSANAVFIGAAVYFCASVAVLMLGLALMGRDGKVLTYAGLVLVNGSLATWRCR